MMEPALIGLRILVYAGSIAAAGGVLFALSFPGAADQVRSDIGRQIRFGCLLLLAVEPLRYFAFQLAVAQGDWSQAFAPDMRWMAFANAFDNSPLSGTSCLSFAFVTFTTVKRMGFVKSSSTSARPAATVAPSFGTLEDICA